MQPGLHVILREGMGFKQYVHFYFFHGVRVCCAPEILKRRPDPPKRTKPVEPLMNFEQENIVLEFSYLKLILAAVEKMGWRPHEVYTAAVQAKERRCHMKIWVLGALEIWQQIFVCLLGM